MKVVLINHAHARPHFLTIGYYWFLGGMGLEERGNLGNYIRYGCKTAFGKLGTKVCLKEKGKGEH